MLPTSAIKAVAQEIEPSGRWKETTNYGELIGEHKCLIKLHFIRRLSRGGVRRKSWLDVEVRAAWDES